MSVITFPGALYVSRMSWSQQRFDMGFRSATGGQAIEVAFPLWYVTFDVDSLTEEQAGAWKALLMQLRGRINQLAIWDQRRPQPLGTLRGSLILGTNASAGDAAITIAGGVSNANKTLIAGDLIGFGSGATQQVVMVIANATADASGNVTVTVEPPLRNAFTAGAAITWDKPCALFRRVTSKAGWDYQGTTTRGFALDLIEDWRT